MKTFYTERDIVDLHAAGVREIAVNDDVVLTDLAREKASDLGIALNSTSASAQQPYPSSPLSSQVVPPKGNQLDLATEVKARVVARLGTNQYDNFLDQIIPLVLARLKDDVSPGSTPSSAKASNGY